MFMNTCINNDLCVQCMVFNCIWISRSVSHRDLAPNGSQWYYQAIHSPKKVNNWTCVYEDGSGSSMPMKNERWSMKNMICEQTGKDS